MAIHKRWTRSIFKSLKFHWESVTKYLTGHNCFAIRYNILTSTLTNSKSIAWHTKPFVPWSARRKDRVQLSLGRRYSFSRLFLPTFSPRMSNAHRAWRLSDADHCSQKLSHFFADCEYKYPRARARRTPDTMARRGLTTRDGAGDRGRPRAAGNGRGPAASRESVSRATIDGRETSSVLARDTDASRAYVSKAFSGGVYALESCK